jgi:hypothetical protein
VRFCNWFDLPQCSHRTKRWRLHLFVVLPTHLNRLQPVAYRRNRNVRIAMIMESYGPSSAVVNDNELHTNLQIIVKMLMVACHQCNDLAPLN